MSALQYGNDPLTMSGLTWQMYVDLLSIVISHFWYVHTALLTKHLVP